jgi:hypothetical protein
MGEGIYTVRIAPGQSVGGAFVTQFDNPEAAADYAEWWNANPVLPRVVVSPGSITVFATAEDAKRAILVSYVDDPPRPKPPPRRWWRRD